MATTVTQLNHPRKDFARQPINPNQDGSIKPVKGIRSSLVAIYEIDYVEEEKKIKKENQIIADFLFSGICWSLVSVLPAATAGDLN